jgi:UDP-N-acetylmuramoylalanine--D-glutamate ligase
MKIAILGFAAQGQSAYEYWKTDNEITICDADPHKVVPEGVASQLGPDYLKGLDRFDLLVRTPVLHPRDIIAANSPDIVRKITTVTNEFFAASPTKNIIGVTGTKGKGTTCTLIAKMLQESGKRVHLGGNIGIPPLELLKDDIQPDDYVVLELANFQLIDLKYSPPLAVCLMVVPEHQDWHEDMEEYVAAKQQLFAHQVVSDTAIYYAANPVSVDVASASVGTHIPYYEKPGAMVQNDAIVIDGQEICKVSEIQLLGTHNWQNVCAAVTAVWQITQDVAAIHSVATTFSGLGCRLEFRREVSGVRYYNDSFAATPEAAAAALEAIPGKKVMILGGKDRGLELTNLVEALQKHADDIRHLLLIGESGPRIATNLQELPELSMNILQNTSMGAIVAAAHDAAQPDDSVVLSPGFPSFDMFKDFVDRGRQFNEAVAKL